MSKKSELYVKSEGFISKNRNEFENAVFDGFYLKRGEDKVLPITLKRENGYKTIDFQEDTSGIIVGQSGTGKTYFIRNVIKQWAMTTRPEELQLIVFDRNKLIDMEDVESLPHVLGVESDVSKLETILDGLLDECLKRKEVLKEHEDTNLIQTLKGYNEKNEDKIPNIVFIVDDLTSILYRLSEDNVELYETIKGKLSKISQIGSYVGVRLLLTAHRPIDSSIPRYVLANSSFKFGLRLDTTFDYQLLGLYRNLGRTSTSKDEDSTNNERQGLGEGIMSKNNGEGLLKTKGKEVIKAQSIEDESNHDMKDIVEFWKGKEIQDVTKNIFSEKLKSLFK